MILTTAALVAQASPAASPAATSTPSAADAKIAANAKAWFISLQHGKVLDASQLTAQMSAALTPSVLSDTANQIGPLGDPTSFNQTDSGVKENVSYYIYNVGFKGGSTLRFEIAFDSNHKIVGLRLFPGSG